MSRLCDRRRFRFGLDEAVDEVDELVIEGGAVGLELGRAAMVGLWVSCDGGFAVMVSLWVFLWWFAEDL